MRRAGDEAEPGAADPIDGALAPGWMIRCGSPSPAR